MIDIDQIAPNAHRIVIMEEFHQADAQRIVEFARQQNAGGKGGNLLLDLTAMATFNLSAISAELAHLPTLMQLLYKLDRIAIVSDDEWVRNLSRLESALLPGVTYQVYDDDEEPAARAWIMGETDEPRSHAFFELELGKPGIAAFELSGRLDLEQAKRGVELVRQRLEQPDCSRLLLVIRSWHGFDMEAMFNGDLIAGKFDVIDSIERYAIVGGPGWVRTAAQVARNFITPKIRTFDLYEQSEAVAWLEG